MIGAPLALLLALAQAPTSASPCARDDVALLREATELAETFDLQGAAGKLDQAESTGCPEVLEARVYLRGLVAQREAARLGGSAESVEPIRRAIDALDAMAGGAPGSADVAKNLLVAGIAAAQNERDDMWIRLEHALRLEDVQLEAAQSGAPIVTAHEIAGELWLQVHRYEDARRFFTRAADRVGRTPRVTLGLARTAARMKEIVTACAEYATFTWWWGVRTTTPPEVAEARTFLAQPACRSLAAQGQGVPAR